MNPSPPPRRKPEPGQSLDEMIENTVRAFKELFGDREPMPKSPVQVTLTESYVVEIIEIGDEKSHRLAAPSKLITELTRQGWDIQEISRVMSVTPRGEAEPTAVTLKAIRTRKL